MFERCPSKVLLSAISVEAGDGDPISSKDSRVDDVPENVHIGIRISPPKNALGSVAHEVHLHQCTHHGQQAGGNGNHGLAGRL